MRYILYTREGTQVANTAREDEVLLSGALTTESRIYNSKLRAGRFESAEGVLFAFSEDKDHIRSSQKFKATARAVLESLKHIRQISDAQKQASNQNISRLIHNLTSLNAHNIQEIYSIIPQEELSRKSKGHIDYIKRLIQQEPYEVSRSLLRIAKNNAAMKAEFSVFRKLFISKPELHPTTHVMHKVLMNVLYLFFPDFTDKDVVIIIDPSTETAWFDYESMHVALYHLIDNAAKYTRPNSIVHISMSRSNTSLTITIEMHSTYITDEDVTRMFEEGYSGERAKKIRKSGDGLGMYIVRRIIESNKGSILVQRVPTTNQHQEDPDYSSNIFLISLPQKKQRNA